jgi:hypothetical protein
MPDRVGIGRPKSECSTPYRHRTDALNSKTAELLGFEGKQSPHRVAIGGQSDQRWLRKQPDESFHPGAIMILVGADNLTVADLEHKSQATAEHFRA